MVIDTCTYTGHWPFRKLPCETLAETAALAEKEKITHIICTNLNAIFYIDAMEGNRELLEEYKAYDGGVTVLPFAVINPMYIEWERDLRECAELGFAGIQLAPQYHNYALSDACAVKAYRLAGELGLAVKIDVGFEDSRQRSHLDAGRDISDAELAALLSADDKPLTIVSTAKPNFMKATTEAANKRENVFFNLIYLDSFTNRWLESCLESLSSKRLCFGTQTPFRYIEPQYVKLFGSAATNDEQRKEILYENLIGKISGLS